LLPQRPQRRPGPAAQTVLRRPPLGPAVLLRRPVRPRVDGHALGIEPLREVTVVAHDDDGSTRRWFTSSSMDLFVWLDPAGRVVAVQLACGKPADEHLASWDARWPDRW